MLTKNITLKYSIKNDNIKNVNVKIWWHKKDNLKKLTKNDNSQMIWKKDNINNYIENIKIGIIYNVAWNCKIKLSDFDVTIF